MALGSGSITVPSTSMASFFGKLQADPRRGVTGVPAGEPEPPPAGGSTQVYGQVRGYVTHEGRPKAPFSAFPQVGERSVAGRRVRLGQAQGHLALLVVLTPLALQPFQQPLEVVDLEIQLGQPPDDAELRLQVGRLFKRAPV